MHRPKPKKNQYHLGNQNIVNSKNTVNIVDKNFQELKTNTNVHNTSMPQLTVQNNGRNDLLTYPNMNGLNSNTNGFSFIPIQHQNTFAPPNNTKYYGKFLHWTS